MFPYERLEQELQPWCGRENVAVCSSGTAALHIALEALELPKGSEVVLPDFTMVACARAVALAGLVPVFVDCGPDMLLDIDPLEEACSSGRASAIMAVHIYGRRCDMEAINRLASAYNLRVVEDMAELHGIHPHPATDAACWSFYRNKVVSGEEGGCVAFLFEGPTLRARSLRSMGFTDKHDFMHLAGGHNYRLADCLAEKVLASLRRFDAIMFLRRQIEALYDAACPPEWRLPPRESPWVYDLRIPGLANQDEVVKAVSGARHAFKPMTIQPEFARCRRVGGINASQLAREVVYFQIRPGITNQDAVLEAFEAVRKTVYTEAKL